MSPVALFADQSYEIIQQRKLERVPSNRDKRPWSMIWDALGPTSAEQAQMYIELDSILGLTFAETSNGPWLRMRGREMGVQERPAVKAERLGVMTGPDGPFDIPLGARFTIETLNYVATERRSQGLFLLQCETPGVVGNQFFGRLIPVDNIRGLVRAELSDIVVPGEDDETDEAYLTRYIEKVNAVPFGGNVDDYVQKVKAIEGVGGCEVYPVRRGNGTADIVIIDSAFNPPTALLIDRVQEAIDPAPGQTGIGMASIDHDILVLGVTSVAVNVDAQVITSPGLTVAQLESDIQDATTAYMLQLRQSWERQDRIMPKQPLVVRVAQLISAAVNIPGVEDFKGIHLNGLESNLTLGLDQVPTLGELVLHG